MRIKYITLLLLLVIISTFSCIEISDYNYICSPNKSQCITVVDIKDKRYIINGRKKLPVQSDYIILQKTSNSDINDSFICCWETNGYSWTVYEKYLTPIEVNLDTTKYRLETTYEKKHYSKLDGCFSCGVSLKWINPKGAAVIFSAESKE